MYYWKSLVVCTVVLFLFVAQSNSAESHIKTRLAPSWPESVLRWEYDIIDIAHDFSLDPDLVAAVMYVESTGYADRESYAGAVGLMGIMPLEEGFTGRPSAEELLNPRVNIRWGIGILTQILKQADGDLHAALAAYNGGWEQAHIKVTRDYSADVLHHYARAIASKQNNPLLNVTRWTVAIDIQSGYGYTNPLLLGHHEPFQLDLVGQHTVLDSYESEQSLLRVVAHAVPIFETPSFLVADPSLPLSNQ